MIGGVARASRFALVLLFLLACSVSSSAQTQSAAQTRPVPGRPFRGLFGGAQQGDPTRPQTLDLSLSFLGGYDDNLTATTSNATGGLGDPRLSDSGSLGHASATLSYRKKRRDDSYFAGGRMGFRYYPTISELNAADYGASAGLSVKPSRRTQLGLNQDVSYQPYLSLFATPAFAPPPGGGLPPSTVDYGLTSHPSITYSTSASGTYDLARRTHASGGYWFSGFDFTESSQDGRQRQHTANAGLGQDVSKRVRLGGRYTYEHWNGAYFGPPQLTTSHGVEGTFDYSRTLRSRRQVSFGFSAGYSRVETGTAAADRAPDNRTTGSARLSVDLGRTWSAHGAYRRGLRYVPGVAAPVFSDNAEAGAAGLIGRRVDLSFAVLYFNGETLRLSAAVTTASPGPRRCAGP